MEKAEAERALRQFWEAAHRKYGDDIRFGLNEQDRETLLRLEKKISELGVIQVEHSESVGWAS